MGAGLTRATPDPQSATQPRTERWMAKSGVHDREFGDPAWHIALDGSKVGRYVGTARASYAVTATDAEGEVQLALSGTVHAALPCQNTSGRGELEAILALLRNFGAFPVQFYTDYQRAIDGLNRGKAWCCSAKRRDADLWRLIWARYEDLAAEGLVSHAKVKAHTALYRICLLYTSPSPRDRG